jgi:hypothetical protein
MEIAAVESRTVMQTLEKLMNQLDNKSWEIRALGNHAMVMAVYP